MWVATTVLKHRRRRPEIQRICEILAIHRLASIRIRGAFSLFSPSLSDRHPGPGTRDGLKTSNVLLGRQVLQCTFAPLAKPQVLWIDEGIIPRRASFSCHVAIPCFHLEESKCTSVSDQATCFLRPCLSTVKRTLQSPYVSESVCHNSLPTSPADLACSSAATSVELSAC